MQGKKNFLILGGKRRRKTDGRTEYFRTKEASPKGKDDWFSDLSTTGRLRWEKGETK